MSKAMEDMRKEAEVIGTIKTCRRHKIKDSEILSEIMEEYDLTEADAEAYMELCKDIA